MYDISSGLILIDGFPIGSLSSKWLRENITVVEQQSVLFNTTIEENILLGNTENGQEISPKAMHEVIDFAMLQSIIDSVSNGIDTVVGVGGSKLSGGQRQRIALARARIRDTPILILDESVSALDTSSRQEIMESIRAWRKGKTTIVITHELEQIRDDDYVFVLADGRTVTHGLRGNLSQEDAFNESALNSPMSPQSPYGSMRQRPISDIASPFSDAFEVDGTRGQPGHKQMKRMTMPVKLEDFVDNQEQFVPPPIPTNDDVRYSRFTRASVLRPQSAFYYVPPYIENVDADKTFEIPDLTVSAPKPAQHARPTVSLENMRGNKWQTILASRSSQSLRPISMFNHQQAATRPKSIVVPKTERPKSAYFPGFSAIRRSVYFSEEQDYSDSPELPKADPIYMKYISASDSAKFNVSTYHISVMCYKSIPNKWMLWLGVFIAAVNGALTPVFSFTVSALINQMTPGVQASGNPNTWIALALCISLADGLTAYTRTVILTMVGDRWVKRLRMQAFQSILQQDLDWYSRNQVDNNDLNILLMSYVEDMRVLVTNLLSISATTITLCLICLIWVMVLGWRLCVIGLALIPCFYLSAILTKYLVLNLENKCIYLNAIVEEIIHETVAGIRTLRILALEKVFIKKFDHAIKNYMKAKYIDCFLSGLGFGVNEMVPLLCQGILLWYGMKLIADGTYSAANVVQVFTILFFGISSIGTLLTSLPEMHGIFLTALRLFQIIDFKSELSHEKSGKKSKQFQMQRNIVFNNVHFSYVLPENATESGEPHAELGSKRQRVKGLFAPQRVNAQNNLLVQVLNSFTAVIQCNETTAIVGPSGSGKSTIVSLLTKLYTPTGGSIRLDGSNITDIDTDVLRREIAVVGQMPLNFFGGSIYENITFALNRPVTLSEVRAVCKECAIDEFISALPDGYDTFIGGSTGPVSSGGSSLLSGGQMQRIGIARALIRQPKLLILDECTSGLDVKSTSAIKETLDSYKKKKNMTILIITHQDDVAAIADTIITVHEGKVVKRTSKSE